MEGSPARCVEGVGPHLPHPDGGGARHLCRPRHQGGDQRRGAQPGRPGRPGPGPLRAAGAGGVGGPRGGRRPPPPHGRAVRRRPLPVPPRHRPAAHRGLGRGGLGQRLPRRLAHRGGPRRGGPGGDLPADHRCVAGGGPRRVAPRMVAHRLGPPGWGGGGRPHHRVRAPGHRRQLRLLHRGGRTGASGLSHRRGGRGRLVGDHQAPGHRGRGVGGDGDRPAALRDRRPPLPQHRRGGPLRHRRRDPGGTRPGARLRHTRAPGTRRGEGLPQPVGRVAELDDLRPHRARHRGEGRTHPSFAGGGPRRCRPVRRVRRAADPHRQSRCTAERRGHRAAPGHGQGRRPRTGGTRVLERGHRTGACLLPGAPSHRTTVLGDRLRGLLARPGPRPLRGPLGGPRRRPPGGGPPHRLPGRNGSIGRRLGC